MQAIAARDTSNTLDAERLYTVDEFWEISQRPENARKMLELVDGKIVIKWDEENPDMPPPGWEHGFLISNITFPIDQFIRAHKLGRLVGAETGFVVGFTDNGLPIVRGIDVGFIAAARIPQGRIPQEHVPFAPDLAIEVVSPSDSAGDIQRKIIELLQGGTRLIWVVYPTTQTVMIVNADGARFVDINGMLDGGAVLPDFSLAVKAIFTLE
jgi:Uma2 family endonuclease